MIRKRKKKETAEADVRGGEDEGACPHPGKY
jgi:hypothetical protein